MTKGDELEKLLDEGDTTQQQMNAIFTQYNVPFLELKALPPEGLRKWERLMKQQDVINTQIGKLFNPDNSKKEHNKSIKNS